MKIIVITDAHANLPALKAVLEEVTKLGYDAIFHTGDSIAIGPYPAECLDLLLNTPRIQFVAGNHESYFVQGLPTPQPTWMSDGEVLHQHWTHSQLLPQSRSLLAQWQYVLEHEFEGVEVTFTHYGVTESRRDFVSLVNNPTATDLDEMFSFSNGSLVFYGHDHSKSDIQGKKRYVNPGSLGCSKNAVARYCVAEFARGRYIIEHCVVAYDDKELYEAFERRNVPERHFIYKAFFGGRFPTGWSRTT